ncbi:MAG: hypothetical protein JRJ49_07475 [Deltaproteobacteria bacterium]|nr:hypothetical protein [Deltaproteobacteria bacterium]
MELLGSNTPEFIKLSFPPPIPIVWLKLPPSDKIVILPVFIKVSAPPAKTMPDQVPWTGYCGIVIVMFPSFVKVSSPVSL